MIGTQSYLSLTWALADRIIAVAGQALCTPDVARNPESPTQLVSQFVAQNSKSANLIFTSIRDTFGWPIALSYQLRNHFIHDGGQYSGQNFFAGESPQSGFAVSTEAWARILKRVETRHGVKPTFHRRDQGWPVDACVDLRPLLAECEHEIDDALGILIGSACLSMSHYVGFFLGEDD